jgi:hypothetical protein
MLTGKLEWVGHVTHMEDGIREGSIILKWVVKNIIIVYI